ncbi:MAG: glutathione peroxidase [bacterium]|nr:glutathione peroxidase [bacterium]
MKTLLILLILMMPTIAENSVHDFTVTTIDGDTVSLSQYKSKVLLVVNVASKCGYTKHYSSLEQLYRTYKDKGLVVLGFPANDFGAQEPGSDEEIAEFCRASFNVSFPMFSKITVKGQAKAPLFDYLTQGGGNKEFAGALEWNFVKFLINRDGKIIHRFNHRLDPLDPQFIAAVESALK